MSWSRISPCLFAALLSIAPDVAADPAAVARFHDELARKHYQNGNFEAALREFFLEQRAAPNARIAYNIALCFEELKRDGDAFMFFQEYLASGDADPERQKYAKERIVQLESKTARVLVVSEPPGAEIYVDKKEHGSYGTTPRVVAVPAGDHRIWVERTGYRAAETRIVAQKGEQLEAKLLTPLIVGDLSLQANAPGKAVLRNSAGAIVGQGAVPGVLQVPPGDYAVSIEASGYLTWSGLAAVKDGQRATLDAVLRLAPASTGDVTITSNVPGALIELDGRAIGLSPSVLPAVAVGSHRLRVRAPSIVPWEGAVSVRSNERSWVTVTLEQPPQVKRSSATWLAGGLGVAALIGAGVTGLLASSAHSDFEAQSADADRSDLRDRGVALNAVSDTLLVTGLVAAGAATILYFTTAETTGRPSSASVSQGKR